jgi:alcohol dehydrogenase (cytochrome c)
MRFPIKETLLSSILLCIAMSTGLAQTQNATKTVRVVSNFVTVTDDMMRAPKPENWLMNRGNYQAWGYSLLSQINKANAKNLQLVWVRAMEAGINETTPLVYNGVMYLGNPGDVIQAIDAATGDLLWEYRRQYPQGTLDQLMAHNLGQRKRSIALYGDQIYSLTWDNYVIALSARTGELVWQSDRGDDVYTSNTGGPIVANGVVVAGSTCQWAGYPCYVTGHDAKTGKELWRNELIPHPGQPGDETWAGSPYESRWMTGVWGELTYDPELDLVYYGSSGVGPASETQRNMPGATMAGTDTRFAVRPKTGEIAWKHQVLPRDNWDQDCTFEMMIIDTPVNPSPEAGMMSINPNARRGPRKTLTGVPCKTGIAWSFDAANGEFLWAKPTVVQNLVAQIDTKGLVTVNEDTVIKEVGKVYHVCPTHMGGRDWPSGAYDPRSNIMYIQLSNLCTNTAAVNRKAEPKYMYNSQSVNILSDGKDKVGRIDAISVETGKTAWSWETRAINYSPILATAGGLLFNGSLDGYLRALDSNSSQVLWQTRLASEAEGGTITYSINGRQYIAIVAGGGQGNPGTGMTPEVQSHVGSNAVYVFALPER